MRFFFRSKQFKIILTSVSILLALTVVCVLLGGKLSPQADLVGSVLAPFRTAGTKISQAVGDFVANFTEGEEAQLKNAELEGEIADLREQLSDYEKTKKENENEKNNDYAWRDWLESGI